MRNHITHIGLAAVLAAIATGCSRPAKNNTHDTRYYTESGRDSGSARQYMKLDGCIQRAATADGEFELHEVTVPPAAEQPIGQESMERPLILPGSWVRMVGDAEELKANMGKRVEVQGTVQDSGANTMGTAGRNDTQGIPTGANANAVAPRIAVEHVRKIADSCRP